MQLKKDKVEHRAAESLDNFPMRRESTLKMLANSTICVFQWNKSRYRCFCCSEPFSDMNKLKEHTMSKHTLDTIEKHIIVHKNKPVKVEISHNFCRICNTKIDTIELLRKHLTEEHGIDFEIDDDLLVPFKIENADAGLKCQLCSETFTAFRKLNIHMNQHYKKQVCHICGVGFPNSTFLHQHKVRSHAQLHCKECDVTFEKKNDKKEHDVKVHDFKFVRKKRFPCPYCPERFYQENFRVQHLVEKHGMKKPEHTCSICKRTYITKSLCNNHIKLVHMKDKKVLCDYCNKLFYTKSALSRHIVSHTGERNFRCLLCDNLYASQDSLRRHILINHKTD